MASKKSPKEKTAPKKRAKSKEKKPHYVNAKEFTADILEYYNSGTDDIGEKLGQSIYKIATGLSYAPNFINYSYKDDMIGDAIVKMFSALQLKKFNIDTGNNPFSYFTTIAFHAFINRIKKEKKQRQVISDYQEMVYEELASEFQMNTSGQKSGDTDEN
jgi:DNA-directed RNA polymerase specialized sigma24 family protein